MATVNIDAAELHDFFDRMGKAADGQFKQEMALFLEGIGDEFLRIVQDEIVRRQVMDTRQLLHSFERSADGNVWQLSDGGLMLEVGTNVDYASYVNDGHWTNKKGQKARFVPGYWKDDGRFVYDPSARGGMLLKQKWVPGKPYFDSALRIIDKMMPDLLDAKLQQWIDEYFGKEGVNNA